MRHALLATLPFVLLAAGPALAEPSCPENGAPMPMWKVAKHFEDAGGTIQQMKVSNGCYEIYGHEGNRRVEVFFHPQTGDEIARE